MIECLIVAGAACVDRFVVKRQKVNIKSIKKIDDDSVVRFSLGYETSSLLTQGVLVYSLRNKNHPTTVISRTRPVIFSDSGESHEYITFEREELERESGEKLQGKWVLDIKIERSHCFVNPLYKIFPLITIHTEEFIIT